MFPLLRHLVVVVFIIALLNIALLKVNMQNSDIKQAFTNMSKMQLMERDAAGVFACNVVFL